MFEALRRYRQRRILRTAALPDALWREACRMLPFLAHHSDDEIARLRDLVVLFLDAKGIVGAQGHDVTPLQRAIIAIQACALVLNLDLALYEGFENVVVYPGEFVPGWEYEDEYGVVHRQDDALAGEAMPRGPVVLSWPDVAASADFHDAGMNLVIHEFAHKIDMHDGSANGCPPLPDDTARRAWQRVMRDAYGDFRARVDGGEDTAIDPYAAEAPGEFFAVLSEVFFADPLLLRDEYPDVYREFARFYRQDPAARQGETQ
jgi:Mlc titration factor MtfA (ptsG expression regulator)